MPIPVSILVGMFRALRHEERPQPLDPDIYPQSTLVMGMLVRIDPVLRRYFTSREALVYREALAACWLEWVQQGKTTERQSMIGCFALAHPELRKAFFNDEADEATWLEDAQSDPKIAEMFKMVGEAQLARRWPRSPAERDRLEALGADAPFMAYVGAE